MSDFEIFNSIFAAMLGIALMLMFVGVIIYAFEYVCKSLFLYKIADANKLKNKWMAWVPILQEFYIGEVAGELNGDKKFTEQYTIAMISGFLLYAGTLFFEMHYIISLTGILLILIFEMIAFYKIFKRCIPDLAVLFTILIIINPVSSIIEIIFICNKEWYSNKKDNEKVL